MTEACVDDQYSTRNKDSVCLLEELLHLTHVSIGTRQVVENLQCVIYPKQVQKERVYKSVICMVSAGHMTFSQSDPSNRSHDRLFKSRDAQKSAHYLDNAHLA